MKELILIIGLLLLYDSDQSDQTKGIGSTIMTVAYLVVDADTAIVDTMLVKP